MRLGRSMVHSEFRSGHGQEPIVGDRLPAGFANAVNSGVHIGQSALHIHQMMLHLLGQGQILAPLKHFASQICRVVVVSR
ncbi:hypothetical protein D3C81_1824690 [compost metagenome]